MSFIFLMMGCSSAELVDYWKNPEVDHYNPNKVFVIGVTPNVDARKMFEQELKQEFNLRGVEAVTSLERFDSSFGTERKTEEQLSDMESNLLQDGFDTILLTKIIGIEDREVYHSNYDSNNETYRKFREDLFMNQDIYYNPNYYNRYTVYHAETSMYCICPTKDRDLIWKGYVDIIDPQSINKTVNDYVKLIILVFEEQLLIEAITDNNQENKEAIK